MAPASSTKITKKSASNTQATVDNNAVHELDDAIRALSQSALEADVAFSNVEITASAMAQSPSTPKGMKDELVKLLEAWKGYHKLFVNLLWNTRGIAGMGESTARDLSKNVVQYLVTTSATNQAKEAFLDKYLAKLKQEKDGSQELHSNWETLQNNVKSFINAVNDLYPRDSKTPEDEREKEHEFESKVHDLQAKINSITNQVLEIYEIKRAKEPGGVATARNSIIDFFVDVLPDFFLKNAVDGFFVSINDDTDERKIEALMKDQHALESQLAQVYRKMKERPNPDMGALKKLSSQLSTFPLILADMTKKFGAFGNIHAKLIHDVEQVLKLMSESEDVPIALLEIRAEEITADYGLLEQALSLYAASVTLPPRKN